jgi:hypothetical protein
MHTEERSMMGNDITAERILAAAEELGQPEFTRAELAAKLDASTQDLKDAVKAARQSGRLEKVGENDEGKGVFRLARG